MKVNTVKPIVNRVRPANVFHKTHSPSSRPFKKTTVLRTNFTNQKLNTAKVNAVSTVGGKRETAVKPSADFMVALVAFGGSKGYITSKGKIKTGKLDFEDVCFVKELQHFNLFSVSQMCDKKNKVLFTDSECLGCLLNLRVPDENQATTDESNKWHRRLGHVNFKKLNKLVKGNLVREFKNKDVIEFCGLKGIKREYSNARTPQQMELLREEQLLVTKPHNKTPYELLTGDSEKEDGILLKDCFVLPIWPSYLSTITPDLKTAEKRDGPREEEQVFMDDLERLKRQEKEANEEAGALRKKFEQETENLVIQVGAVKPSSTNIFSTVSTPAKASSTNFVNTVSIPVSTASPHEGLSLADPTNPKEDDSEIPPLEDIYQNSTDVAQGHRQEDGIDYHADFAPVFMLEAIRSFGLLPHTGSFIVYQIDVKSAFLYGKIDEEPIWCDELSINKESSDEFNGELTFFLGIQVNIKQMKPLVQYEEASDEAMSLPKSSHLMMSREFVRIVTMPGANLTGNPITGVSPNSWCMVDSFHAMCKSRPLWLLLLQEANIVACLQAAVGMFMWIQNPNELKRLLTIELCISRVLIVFRETIGEASLMVQKHSDILANLVHFLLAQVSTDSAKLVPLGNDSTAIETLKKIPPRVQSVN
ncbi:ribonuclease H-like domain-containing protein [Tanacetum coccineum]